MEWPKVKNIIIIILLLVNGFLLVLVGGQKWKVRNYERSALTRAVQLLEQNGITVSDKAESQAAEGVPSVMTASRDLTWESAIAAALLGEDVVCTDQSGGLYVYSGGGGTAIFRANGDFNAILSDTLEGVADEEIRDHSERLLKEMKVEGELAAEETGGNERSLCYRQLLDGIPLYNCEIIFEYSGGKFLAVRGTLLTCGEPVISEEEEIINISTALIRFLEGVLERQDLCSEITSIRPGYSFAQSFGSGVYLTPVWLVSTDVSDYYLNGVTGELTSAKG